MINAQRARQHAQRIVAGLPDELREQLADAPIATVRDALDIRVIEQPEELRPSTDAGCPVAGFYDDDPPTIVIAAAASHGRRRFSVLHELGHHLLLRDDAVTEALWVAPDASIWRETICNHIAAELLLPEWLVDEHIGAAGPTAREVVALERASRASRSACAVRASERLPGPGYVVLANRTGRVGFVAAWQMPYTVARGSQQPDDHVLTQAGADGHARESGATLTYASGHNHTDPMHADCHRDGDFVYGVFTLGRPPWGGLSILPVEPPARHDVHCDRCQDSFEVVGSPCRRCRDHACPNCGRCSCTRTGDDEVDYCRACTVTVPVRQLVDGLCTNCR